MIATALLAGCSNFDDQAYDDVADPFEEVNRITYGFNGVLDYAILEPTAQGYVNVTPEPVQTCLSNMVSNLKEPLRVVGNAIVGEGVRSATSGVRFVINTVVGGFGCLDAADKAMGVPKYDTDIGLGIRTQAKPQNSIYIVLPLFGSSTFIDALGFGVGETYLNPININTRYNWYYTDASGPRLAINAVRSLEIRAQLLTASELVDVAALDSYIFVRDAYLQRRAALAAEIRDRDRW